MRFDNGILYVSEDGSASSVYSVLPVTLENRERMHTYSSHPAVVSRIMLALETPGKCLILKAGGKLGKRRLSPGILVVPVWPAEYTQHYDDGKLQRIARDPWAVGLKTEVLSQNRDILELTPLSCLYCRYVGCVSSEVPSNIEIPLINCMFGKDVDSDGKPLPDVNAREAVSAMIDSGIYEEPYDTVFDAPRRRRTVD